MYYYNQNDYPSVKYDRPSTSEVETVKSSGCGVCAACIVVNNLAGRELYTVSQMAKFSVDNGARDNSGTNINTLLNALCKAHSAFSFKTTTSESELVNHIKKGGLAICNQGDSYNVFSTAGHFVVAYKMSGKNIEILDPQMYDGKYDAYKRPQRIIKKTANGCIVSQTEMGKATADRNPAYFLVSYTKPKGSVKSKGVSYTVGRNYTLQTDLKVRTGAGTNYSQKKRSQLTESGKSNAKLGYYAVLKKGTVVTVNEIKKVGNDIWLRIPSGWIAGYYQGNLYVKL